MTNMSRLHVLILARSGGMTCRSPAWRWQKPRHTPHNRGTAAPASPASSRRTAAGSAASHLAMRTSAPLAPSSAHSAAHTHASAPAARRQHERRRAARLRQPARRQQPRPARPSLARHSASSMEPRVYPRLILLRNTRAKGGEVEARRARRREGAGSVRGAGRVAGARAGRVRAGARRTSR